MVEKIFSNSSLRVVISLSILSEVETAAAALSELSNSNPV
jgi:hypothetical protein